MKITLSKHEVIQLLVERTLIADKRSLLLVKYDREDLNLLTHKEIKQLFKSELEDSSFGEIIDTGLWDLIFVDCPYIVDGGLKGEML